MIFNKFEILGFLGFCLFVNFYLLLQEDIFGIFGFYILEYVIFYELDSDIFFDLYDYFGIVRLM